METAFGSIISYWLIHIMYAAIIVLTGRIVVKWVVKFARKIMVRANMDPIVLNFLSTILNVVLLLLILVAALDQLGVNTTSMIAVLGAAGLAVALALKDSLQNFAAGVLLIVFRPFHSGDQIEAAGVTGVVEDISLFNTRLKTGDNRAVIVPNGQIYSRTIINFSAKQTRRIDLIIGISYQDDLLKAKQLLQQIVANHEKVLASPAAVIRIADLAESSVNFEVRPWVNRDDHGGVRAELLEQIKLAFDANGISIPYPQMDVHVQQESH